MSSNRRPPGIPAGGQFAASPKEEPSKALTDGDSLQSEAPLVRMQLVMSSRSSGWIYQLIAAVDEIDLDQDYQRGHVWGKNRQRLLIKSLIQRLPVPAIMINDRMSAGTVNTNGEPDYRFAVVDGKQRVTAIGDFMGDKLDVPASWFSPDVVRETVETNDGEYVSWSGLTMSGQRFFSNTPVPVVESQLVTYEAERELFERLNFGGVEHGENDI